MVAAVIAAVEVALFALVPAFGAVVVENAAFEYSTPPTDVCPYTATRGGPPSLFTVARGDVFRLSWAIVCEGFGKPPANATSFEIRSVHSSSFGFSVVSSDVPVLFNYSRVGYLNVSVRAPVWPDIAVLTLSVDGGPTG